MRGGVGNPRDQVNRFQAIALTSPGRIIRPVASVGIDQAQARLPATGVDAAPAKLAIVATLRQQPAASSARVETVVATGFAVSRKPSVEIEDEGDGDDRTHEEGIADRFLRYML